jgi:hypothetical protein
LVMVENFMTVEPLKLRTPPPELAAELPLMVELVTVRVPLFEMPPPESSGTFPPEMVIPEMETTLPLITVKILKFAAVLDRLTVNLSAPGPLISMLFERVGSELVSCTVPSAVRRKSQCL